MTIENSRPKTQPQVPPVATAREIRVNHLKRKRGHQRSVARAQACEKFARVEKWMEVDDDGEPVADPETGNVRVLSKRVTYFCRGRDCTCSQCQRATAKRSAKDTEAKIRLGWAHAEQTGRGVIALSISPPHDTRSLRRALIDVRSFRKRLMRSVNFKRLVGGGVWRIEIRFPDHPHLHLVVEADLDVDVWLPMLRALVSANAHTRVAPEVLEKTVVATRLLTLTDAEDWGSYILKHHYANGFSTLSADEIETALPVLDRFKVRKNTFGSWRGLTPPRVPTLDDRGRKRTRPARKKGRPDVTPEEIVHEDLGHRGMEWMVNEEDGTRYVLMDARIEPVADVQEARVRRREPTSKLRRLDLDRRRQRRT